MHAARQSGVDAWVTATAERLRMLLIQAHFVSASAEPLHTLDVLVDR